MTELEKLTIKERTDFMYRVLNKMDLVKRTTWDHSKLLVKLNWLIELYNELTDWINWEIRIVREYKKTRPQNDPANELTDEIWLFNQTDTLELWELITDKEFKKDKEIQRLKGLIDRLEKRTEKFHNLSNSIEAYGELIEN